ncbi:MAG: glycosyltransferase [Bryobacteraceae bacterium]
MRIAHIVETMEVGGGEMLVAHLTRDQTGRGHRVSVECMYVVGALGEQLRREGIDVHLHNGASASKPALMRSLRNRLSEARVEAVHCHNATATIFGAPAAKMAGARRVISTRHGAVPPPYKRKQEILFSIAARFCHRIVAVCKIAETNLAGAPLAARGRLTTIYNGALPAPAGPSSGELRQSKTGWTVVTVGRLAPPKDHASLLEAAAIAVEAAPDLRLWVVGDGRLRQGLEKQAASLGLADIVTFFGERHDVGGFLGAADLFCLYSNSEGVPVSQLEALAAGLPMVVSDAGGMPEVAPPEASLVVPRGDPRALADALLHFRQRQEEKERWATMAKAHFERHFTLERMCRAYERLYLGE